MSSQRKTVRPRIGIFGIGLGEYWPQFPGLKEQLEGYQARVESRVGQWADVVSAGLVDDAPLGRAAGDLFQREQVDMVYCYVGTYATSSTVLPAVQIPQVPVLVLNLQPTAALDYANTDTKEWLANCCACCVPEISCAFSSRCDIDFHVVSGMLDGGTGLRGACAACLGARSGSGPRRPGCCAPCAAAASACSATPTPACSTCTATSPSTRDSSAPMSRSWRCANLAALVSTAATPSREVQAPRRRRRWPCSSWRRTRRPIRSPTRPAPDALDWAYRVAVGLDRPGGEDFALDGLTYYYRGLDRQRIYEQHRRRLRSRLLTAHLARRAVQRRGRPQELPGDEELSTPSAPAAATRR